MGSTSQAESLLSDEAPIIWLDESEWIIEARQERSRRTMRKILDAAVKLFVVKGYEATTVAQIAQEADIAPGSIYRRFPDKDAVLKAVVGSYYQTRIREFDRLVDERFSSIDNVRGVLELYNAIIFSAYRKDRGMLRLIERSSLTDPELRQTLMASMYHVAYRIADTLQDMSPTFAGSDIRSRILKWHLMQRGVLVSLILADGDPTEQVISLDDERFEAEMLRTLEFWVLGADWHA